MAIKFEFALIGKHGSVLVSSSEEADVMKGQGFGRRRFIGLEQVFNSRRSTFLPDDTLTVRCRIWKKGKSMLQGVKCFARTRIGFERASFVWNMQKIRALQFKGRCIYTVISPENGIPIMDVELVRKPRELEKIKRPFGPPIRVQLHLQDRFTDYSTIRLRVVDFPGNPELYKENSFWIDTRLGEPKMTEFIFNKETLSNGESIRMPENILISPWQLLFSKGIVSGKIEGIQYGSNTSEMKVSEALALDKIIPPNCPTDVKSFYDEKLLCPVKLETNTGTFLAHKLVLSASSSIFETMFSTMKAKDSDCVNIEDLDDDTVSRMLHYIYTKHVEDLTWKSATELYAAGNKYDIPGLKSTCYSYLKENLSTSNACEALLFAENHADEEMKATAMDYIKKHGKEIAISDWRFLKSSDANLAAEVLFQFFMEERLRVS